MRRVFLLLTVLPAAVLAQEPVPEILPSQTPTVVVTTRNSAVKPMDSAPAGDLTTASGQTYRHARVYRVEPDGITYLHEGGLSKLDFEELPESLRKDYGYDPRVAAAYQLAGEDERHQIEAATVLARREASRREQEAAVLEHNLIKSTHDDSAPAANPSPATKSLPSKKSKARHHRR